MEQLLPFIAVLFVSFISLIGLVTISIKKNLLKSITIFLVSLAAGTLIGDVFFHMIPEIYHEGHDLTYIPFTIIGGIMIFFFLEKILHWHHCHNPKEHGHNHHPVAINNLVADGLHNFMDGMIIGSSFIVSTELGIATTIAVILHEIPQEIGDYGILIHSGYSRRKALTLNFITALFALVGTTLAMILGGINEELQIIMLGISAGGFLYIAIADLLPEIKVEANLRKSLIQYLTVALGIFLMFGITFLETHGNGHEEAEIEVHLDEEDH